MKVDVEDHLSFPLFVSMVMDPPYTSWPCMHLLQREVAAIGPYFSLHWHRWEQMAVTRSSLEGVQMASPFCFYTGLCSSSIVYTNKADVMTSIQLSSVISQLIRNSGREYSPDLNQETEFAGFILGETRQFDSSVCRLHSHGFEAWLSDYCSKWLSCYICKISLISPFTWVALSNK